MNLWIKPYNATTQMKAFQQYFPMVLFDFFTGWGLTLESLENLNVKTLSATIQVKATEQQPKLFCCFFYFSFFFQVK